MVISEKCVPKGSACRKDCVLSQRGRPGKPCGKSPRGSSQNWVPAGAREHLQVSAERGGGSDPANADQLPPDKGVGGRDRRGWGHP